MSIVLATIVSTWYPMKIAEVNRWKLFVANISYNIDWIIYAFCDINYPREK